MVRLTEEHIRHLAKRLRQASVDVPPHRPSDWRTVAIDALLEENPRSDQRAIAIIQAESPTPPDAVTIEGLVLDFSGENVSVSVVADGKRHLVIGPVSRGVFSRVVSIETDGASALRKAMTGNGSLIEADRDGMELRGVKIRGGR